MGKVGVIGCGQMGSGIVQVCAQSGYTVIVSEINDKLLQRGLTAIGSSLDRGVQRGKITAREKNVAMSRIRGTTDNRDFGDCALVIEAVMEDLDVKKKIFGELDRVCQTQAILATNTSCLPVSEIAAATRRPEKVLGLHFFNPVPSMKLLEIVRTPATSEVTLETGREFGASLGKTVIVAGDTPGFIVNRLMVPQVLNAIRMAESGAATGKDIDTGITLGLNHPLGPLALADLIGLDTLLFIANSIYNRSGDSQYLAPETLKKMVEAGQLGRKSGKGFYEYK
ncbi:MAG: 3-hydroxybutyryl-CoA dehydrogenase [Chloroflexi bacterium RBG_16_56_11]|nr:MAG: 3-hydroxybutyryl-CoA dehydrogenase [Chloroflexi bacterium RBG_16_56_11]